MEVWHLNSRQMYELMCESYNELEKDPKSYKHAIYFCFIGYHLIEWILNDKECRLKIVEKFKVKNTKVAIRKYISENVAFYQAVRALANGAKHFKIKDKEHVATSIEDNLTWDTIDCTWDKLFIRWGYDNIPVKHNDELHEILNIYKPLKEFYDELFQG